MSPLLISAIVSMILALTCYTIGVFAERKKGLLLPCMPPFFGWVFFLTAPVRV
ncbi:hypothetical protein [Enterococcus asini]|uniref:hypothetical protein n=1 Tax=Enterococcus asini TaxID=57732 RepID=UPI00216B40FE|nr:hypothetical protein [Enterococcus asini]